MSCPTPRRDEARIVFLWSTSLLPRDARARLPHSAVPAVDVGTVYAVGITDVGLCWSAGNHVMMLGRGGNYFGWQVPSFHDIPPTFHRPSNNLS